MNFRDLPPDDGIDIEDDIEARAAENDADLDVGVRGPNLQAATSFIEKPYSWAWLSMTISVVKVLGWLEAVCL